MTLRLLFALILLSIGAGCHRGPTPGVYQGYLEAEYIYIASPYGGALRELSVSRGDTVTSGQPLFALDPEPEARSLDEAKEKLARAQAMLADARKGRRPSEIEALEARLRATKEDLELAVQLLARRERAAKLDAGAVAEEELDETRSRIAMLRAEEERLKADIETARLGSREDQIHAAAADVESAEAVVARAQWALDQKKQQATAAGAVHDTLYRAGEWVAAGSPVVVLLPPENIKVRFFVPEPELAKMQPGTAVTVGFDGAERKVDATIRYVSTRAEFTPPVIYSQQTRAKLIYMVEAHFPANATAGLRPGQPVDVALRP